MGVMLNTQGCPWREAMQAEDFPAGLDVQTVEAAGHFLHLEKPDEVNARVIAFLHSQA